MERIQTAADIELEVFQYGESDRLALCLHGFPDGADCWDNQIETLLGLGYTVWVPNLRGYGNSSGPQDVARYSLSQLLEDIGVLIDCANKKSVLLIARDFGASLAWFFVQQNIRKIEAAVVLNAFHPAMSLRLLQGPQASRSSYIGFFLLPGFAEYFVKLLGRSGAMKPLAKLLKNTDMAKPLEMFQKHISQASDFTPMLNYYRAVADLNYWSDEELSGISNLVDIPVLMINGEKDPWISAELTQGTETLVPNLTMETIPQAGHWIQQDESDIVNELLSIWLRPIEVDP